MTLTQALKAIEKGARLEFAIDWWKLNDVYSGTDVVPMPAPEQLKAKGIATYQAHYAHILKCAKYDRSPRMGYRRGECGFRPMRCTHGHGYTHNCLA